MAWPGMEWPSSPSPWSKRLTADSDCFLTAIAYRGRRRKSDPALPFMIPPPRTPGPRPRPRTRGANLEEVSGGLDFGCNQLSFGVYYYGAPHSLPVSVPVFSLSLFFWYLRVFGLSLEALADQRLSGRGYNRNVLGDSSIDTIGELEGVCDGERRDPGSGIRDRVRPHITPAQHSRSHSTVTAQSQHSHSTGMRDRLRQSPTSHA